MKCELCHWTKDSTLRHQHLTDLRRLYYCWLEVRQIWNFANTSDCSSDSRVVEVQITFQGTKTKEVLKQHNLKTHPASRYIRISSLKSTPLDWISFVFVLFSKDSMFCYESVYIDEGGYTMFKKIWATRDWKEEESITNQKSCLPSSSQSNRTCSNNRLSRLISLLLIHPHACFKGLAPEKGLRWKSAEKRSIQKVLGLQSICLFSLVSFFFFYYCSSCEVREKRVGVMERSLAVRKRLFVLLLLTIITITALFLVCVSLRV